MFEHCIETKRSHSNKPVVRVLYVSPCVYLQEPFVQKKIAKKSKNNMPTEVVQRKIKIKFYQKFWKFWPKIHFLNLCFVQARSR